MSKRVLKRITGVAASTLLAGTVVVGTAQPAQAAAWDCPSGSNPSVWDPSLISTPVPAVYLSGRKVELRYHSGARCAWGRISNGQPRDQIWVDWSSNGGASWTQLGVTSISSGYTQKFTQAYNDRGYKMRACGNAGSAQPLVCTGWY